MCGIYGMSWAESPTRADLRHIREFFTELAVAAQSRGMHAAGFAAVDTEGRAIIHKDNESVVEQINRGTWVAKLMNIGKHTRSLIGHTRWATHGANVPMNAHPFKFYSTHGELVGTHNGIIWNYKQLYPFKGEPLECDSANLFALLAEYQDTFWPKLFEQVNGSYALAMQRANRMYFVRNYGSPCWMAKTVNVPGSVWASTSNILYTAARIADMEITDIVELPPHRMVVTDLSGQFKYAMIMNPDESEYVNPYKEHLRQQRGWSLRSRTHRKGQHSC